MLLILLVELCKVEGGRWKMEDGRDGGELGDGEYGWLAGWLTYRSRSKASDIV